MDGAYEKMLAKVLDPAMPLRLLPPYQGVTDGGFNQFMERVRAELPSWLPTPAAQRTQL